MAVSVSLSRNGAEIGRNKHQLKTEDTRRKLLRSARKIFARNGFEAARLEDIAKDAGFTRGAFYAHFARKEDLFLALLEQQILQNLTRVRALIGTEMALDDRLAGLREYLISCMADPEWSILMLEFKLFAVRHPRMRARLAAAHRTLKASFQVPGMADQLCERLPHPQFRYEAMRSIFEILLHGLTLQRAYDPLSLSEDEASSCIRLVFDMLTGARQPTGSSGK